MSETNTWSGVEWKQIGGLRSCCARVPSNTTKTELERFGIEGSTRLVLDATVD